MLFRWLHQQAERLGIYKYLRYSAVYEPILRWRNPGYFRQLEDDLQFYRVLFDVRPPALIFDVGANAGDKAWVFRQLATRVVCVEPDPKAARILRVRYRTDPRVQVESVALSASAGTATLYVEQEGSAYNTLNPKHSKWASETHMHGTAPVQIVVKTSTLDLLIQRYGCPDYIKLDVEGHELEVLKGFTAIVPIISFEANLPLFREETSAIITRLSALNAGVRYRFRGPADSFVSNNLVTSAEAIDKVESQTESIVWDIFAFHHS